MGECSGEYEAVVFSGVGEGEFYVSIYAREFRRRLGFTPYPGTLNTRLEGDVDGFNRCLEWFGGVLIEPPRIPGAKLAPVRAYPAYLNGYRVWIVRPEVTIYKRDVAEIVADKYLRGLLGLEDGDRVRIQLEDP